jgi:hypothetical protein
VALQRQAGNRAVQRLFYNYDASTLVATPEYADQRVPWDGSKHLQMRKPTDADPKLIELVQSNPTVKAQLVKGLDLEQDILDFIVQPADTLKNNVGKLAKDGPDKENVAAELKAAAIDPNRIFKHLKGKKYPDEGNPLPISWAISSPGDFVAEPSDLKAGIDVREQIPGKMKGTTYWEYMCVLIALVKADGYGKVKTLTKKDVSGLTPAVQALSDYYLQKGIEFDDSSARRQVMAEWGYKLIFAGRTPWADLPKYVALAPGQGKYIFDIVGHTTLVDVARSVPKDGKRIAKPDQVFTPHSEPDN